MHTGVWQRNLKRSDHLQNLNIDGDITKMYFTQVGNIDWFYLSQNGDR
jgi:hypothetical protein